jgi:hypothetical protein
MMDVDDEDEGPFSRLLADVVAVLPPNFFTFRR